MEKRVIEKSFAFSRLEVKAVDNDRYTISGVATTPSPDRDGDILNPLGAEYDSDIPLLWQHDSLSPVGRATLGKATKNGIPFSASITPPTADMPSALAARLAEAWQSLKTGLIKNVSIGFRPLKYAFLDSGGIEFSAFEIMELSLVTIAANADAIINTVKTGDKKLRTASGATPADPAKPIKPLLKPKEGNQMKKSFADQLKDFTAELENIDGELDGIVAKAADTNETPDAATEEVEAELMAKRDAVLKHIERIKSAQERSASKAVAVTEKAGNDEATAKAARSGVVTVQPAEKLEKGIEFARYAMCLMAAKGDHSKALNLAKRHYGRNESIVKALDYQANNGGDFSRIMKATVDAGTSLDSLYAAPLVQYQNFAGDFVDFLRPRTIIGQFGVGGVPALNRIPFNVRIAGQTTGGTAYWVGEGAPKPVTAFDFNVTELRWNKVAAIAALTEELIRFSDPSAERLVRDALAAAVIARMDTDFVDFGNAGTANVKPASITNGATHYAASGVDAAAVREDIKKLWTVFLAANNVPRTAVYIMNSTVALGLSLMTNALGQPEFPGISVNGGTFLGLPVIVSDYAPINSAGEGSIILVNATDVWLADDGQVTVDFSTEASIQFLDNPTNNSSTGTATSLVSLWQTNSVGFKAERFINWARRRASGVAYLTGVNYGAAS